MPPALAVRSDWRPVRLAAMLLLVHLVLGGVIGSAQPLLRSRDGKSDGNGGSAAGGVGKSGGGGGSTGSGDKDPCAKIENVDTDCKCGEEPCNYCLKCGCYGCFSEAGFEMENEELASGSSENPIRVAAIEEGRSNPA